MGKRNEYQRIRDNIMRSIRRQRAKGIINPYTAPLTPRQKGYKYATKADIAELKGWGKRVLTSLGVEDDVDRLLRIAKETDEESRQFYKTRKEKSFKELVANESSVYVYNYQRFLKYNKEDAQGANKLQDWYVEAQSHFRTDEELADFLKRAERDGLEITQAMKYDGTEGADKYISDMTQRLFEEDYIDEEEARDLLKDVSEYSEVAEDFFNDLFGGI